MRVLITGSRDWKVQGRVWGELSRIALHERPPVLTVVHGNCPTGADRFARQWCEEYQDMLRGLMGINFHEERHPADWGRYGRQAGPIRNEAMVDAGADLCLAFVALCKKLNCPRRQVRHLSHGASRTAALARQAGIETREWWED